MQHNEPSHSPPSPPSSAEASASPDTPPPTPLNPADKTFGGDFRRFFVRGLATLMPTLITIWLLTWLWNFLWNSIGQHVIFGIRWIWYRLADTGMVDHVPAGYIRYALDDEKFSVRILGVGLAILLVYIIGVLVGNLIGRWFYRLGERAVMKVPLIRAIYPAVKQVTDFVLADKKTSQFATSRVVAVQARAQGIWSIGFVTNQGYGPLNDATRGDMVTIFIPSTPTAFSGYVIVAHREATVELPLTVEETMRLLLSGGVIVPQGRTPAADEPPAALPAGVVSTPAPADVKAMIEAARR